MANSSRGKRRHARARRLQSPLSQDRLSATPKIPRQCLPSWRGRGSGRYAQKYFGVFRRAAQKKPVAYWFRPRPRQESLPGFPPLTAVALEQVIRFPRPPRTGGIIREIARRQRLPDVENRLHDAPARFDHVGALKQRGIANHAFVKEPLITSTGFRTKIIRVAEIHIHRAEFHDRPWNFRAELQGDSLLRLDVNDELIG